MSPVGALHELECPSCATKTETKASGRQRLRCTNCGALLTAAGLLVASPAAKVAVVAAEDGPRIAEPLTLRLPRPAPASASGPAPSPGETAPAPVRSSEELADIDRKRQTAAGRRGGSAPRRHTAASYYAERVRGAS